MIIKSTYWSLIYGPASLSLLFKLVSYMPRGMYGILVTNGERNSNAYICLD